MRGFGGSGAYVSLILVLFLCSGCSMILPERGSIWHLPQDPLVYLPSRTEAYRPRLSDSARERKFAEFQKIHFSPWFQEESVKDKEDVVFAFQYYGGKLVQSSWKKGYAEYLLRKLERRVCLDEYPNAGWHGITVDYADLKGLPVEDRKLRKVKVAYGEDRIQVSALHPNTPVFVSHVSRDRKWLLVETNFAYGWILSSKVAKVNRKFIEEWLRGDYIALIRDGVPVCWGGTCYFRAYVGSLFPCLQSEGETFTLGVATRGWRGMAVMRKGTISKNDGVLMPLTPNQWNVAVLAGSLIGVSYGWGGRNGTRDCSSLLRDLFVPFGVWLPRHSADQARDGGLYVDISGLEVAEKERVIVRDGEPFFTLLWRRGHIMLYVGSHGGEPVVLHAMGDLVLEDQEGRVMRRMSGHTAITRLQLGKDLNNAKVKKEVNHLKHVAGMTFVAK